MARSMSPADRPTYEQLQEIIDRKDKLISGLYWKTEGLRAAAWFAHYAHDSGMPGYNKEDYAEASIHLFRLLAEQTKAVHDEFSEAHRAVSGAVLAGLPEGEEADHA